MEELLKYRCQWIILLFFLAASCNKPVSNNHGVLNLMKDQLESEGKRPVLGVLSETTDTIWFLNRDFFEKDMAWAGKKYQVDNFKFYLSVGDSGSTPFVFLRGHYVQDNTPSTVYYELSSLKRDLSNNQTIDMFYFE